MFVALNTPVVQVEFQFQTRMLTNTTDRPQKSGPVLHPDVGRHSQLVGVPFLRVKVRMPKENGSGQKLTRCLQRRDLESAGVNCPGCGRESLSHRG